MKDSSLARFRDAGSFMAGILIGLSIMVPMFALMVVDLTKWQTFLLFGAPFILALGITLQAPARHKRGTRLAYCAVTNARLKSEPANGRIDPACPY